MEEPKSYCTECLRYKEKTCPWNYMFADTEYAYDCMDWMTEELLKAYESCDKCKDSASCKMHLNNPNIAGCKKYI